MRSRLFSVAVLATFFGMSAGNAADYAVKQKITLGGAGGWDYLTFDPIGKRLFISRSTHLMVVDPYHGTIIADVPNTPGIHGIALAQDLGKGFTSNGKENSVTVFDLKSLKETNLIKIPGAGPDAIVYEPQSKQVFTFNGHSGDATVINAATGNVNATIPLVGKPEFAVTDGNGTVFVNIEDKSEVVSIDAASAKVVQRWSLAPCESPTGLAIDPKHHLLFAGCDNKLMAIVDAQTGKIVGSAPIDDGVDATGFDPATNTAFSSNGAGTLTVVHEDSPSQFSVAQTVQTQVSGRTMAVDTTNHDIYVVAAEKEPMPPAADGQKQHPKYKDGSFTLLVIGTK